MVVKYSKNELTLIRDAYRLYEQQHTYVPKEEKKLPENIRMVIQHYHDKGHIGALGHQLMDIIFAKLDKEAGYVVKTKAEKEAKEEEKIRLKGIAEREKKRKAAADAIAKKEAEAIEAAKALAEEKRKQRALDKKNIHVKALSQSSEELNISLVIDKKDLFDAINVIHDDLCEDFENIKCNDNS